jgi:quinoprotein glucose dehydrogenase
MNRWVKCLVRVLALVTATSCLVRPFSVGAQRAPQDAEWREYAGDAGGRKYSPLSQITKENIQALQVVWRWPSADREIQMANPALRSTRNEDTPLMIGGVLYTVTPLGMVAALDPATGQTRWVYDPEVYKAGKPGNSGFIHRGLAYWTDGTSGRILHGTNDAYLISIDIRTGKPDPAFGKAGRIDLTDVIPRAVRSTNFMGRRPLIAGDIVIVGNAILDPTRTKEMPPVTYRPLMRGRASDAGIFIPCPSRGNLGTTPGSTGRPNTQETRTSGAA